MKKVIVLLLFVIFVLFLNSAIAAEKVSPIITQGGRYQLLYIPESPSSHKISEIGEITGLYLLDTENGRVWSYSPTLRVGEKMMGGFFSPIPVSGIGMNIKDYNAWMEKIVEEQMKKYQKEK